MRVLSLDPGVAQTGFALLTRGGQRPVVLASGFWSLEPVAPTVTEAARERIRYYMGELDALAREHDFDVVAAESFTTQTQRLGWEALQTLRLLGSIEEWAERAGKPYLEITTMSAKSKIGLTRPMLKGKTKTEVKRLVQTAVVGLTGCELPRLAKHKEHVADAIAVGIAACVGRAA